tara:strand:+ start:544 stop:762 length:219 start_codon:yes stop_codon:yes gene_type:complete
MNIQDKMQEIHNKFGVTEKANYEIQLFVDELIKKDRAKQLTIPVIVKAFYCDADNNPMEDRCEQQCWHCKSI